MKVNSVSQSFNSRKTVKESKVSEKKNSSLEQSKFKKALPYVAGAVILAVSGFAFKNKISKIMKEVRTSKRINESTDELRKEVKIEKDRIVNETLEEKNIIETNSNADKTKKNIVKDETPIEENQTTELKTKDDITEINELTPNTKNICTGFDKEGKPIFEEAELPDYKSSAESIFIDKLKDIDLHDPSVISKIEKIRQAEQYNIDRIINENTHDGKIDIPMMKKVANDYMADINRGETRFHQAADLLEQAHIRQFVKGDEKSKSGMFNLVDSVLTDPVLYRAYQHMPIEESSARLNYLKEHELKSDFYKETMTAEGFFEKTFTRLVEKYQFKKYVEAHGIND